MRVSILLTVALLALAPSISIASPASDRVSVGFDMDESAAPENRSLFRVWFSDELTGNTPVESNLGKHSYCALAKSRTIHISQACGCVVAAESKKWVLRLTADPASTGQCLCQAVCLDPRK